VAVQLKLVMSDHPSSTGLPPIPSSTIDPNLLSPPTSSHQSSIPSRRKTAQSPHHQTRPSPPVLPHRTRLLAAIHMPLKHIIGTLQTIVLPRKQAVSSWARCRPQNFWTNFFRSLKILKRVRTRRRLSRVFRGRRKSLICMHHS
jgi:hypothetical protein